MMKFGKRPLPNNLVILALVATCACTSAHRQLEPIPYIDEVLSIRFKETFPVPGNKNPLVQDNHLILLNEPFPLSASFEPVNPSKPTRTLYFGLHFSHLNPKRKIGEDCPHYQEQISFVTGEKIGGDQVFASAETDVSFMVNHLQRYTIKLHENKLTHWWTFPNPFGDQQFEKQEIPYSHEASLLPNLQVKQFECKASEERLVLVFGEYDYEKKNREEMKEVMVVIGVYQKGTEKLFLQGFGTSTALTVAAYSYDRRNLSSTFKKSFSLTKSGDSWIMQNNY